MQFEALGQALQSLGSPGVMLYVILGAMIGITIGVIPGIGSSLALSLVLPFCFMLPPENALPMMLAISTGCITGGAITSILLGVPGTGVNIATIIDGFPMTRKGEGARAIGASTTASVLGGLASVVLTLAMVRAVTPMVMALRSADMVFIVILGLTFIASLGGESMLKTLITGGLGLLLSFIGYSVVTGEARFTFGSMYLYSGIDLVPFCLGLFALAEVISMAISGTSISTQKVKVSLRDVTRGSRDVIKHWSLWLRSMVIGYIVGVIPGIGGSISPFAAYGQAKATSRHPETFGKGDVAGVIAPQSADNATQGGAILTTLALGVPGCMDHALLLGAFLMVGLIPGPTMMTEHLSLSLLLVLSLVTANIFVGAVCFFATPGLARIATIPSRILAPLLFVIIMVGAYAARERMEDIVVTLIFGALGLAMRRFGLSRAALVLGFILGIMFERYFFIALSADGPLFFVRPISLALIAISILVLFYAPIRRLIERRLAQRKAVRA